jgi:hypothetical protein
MSRSGCSWRTVVFELTYLDHRGVTGAEFTAAGFLPITGFRAS